VNACRLGDALVLAVTISSTSFPEIFSPHDVLSRLGAAINMQLSCAASRGFIFFLAAPSAVIFSSSSADSIRRRSARHLAAGRPAGRAHKYELATDDAVVRPVDSCPSHGAPRSPDGRRTENAIRFSFHIYI